MMGGEDFGRYGKDGTPIFMYFLGTIAKERYDESQKPGGPTAAGHALGQLRPGAGAEHPHRRADDEPGGDEPDAEEVINAPSPPVATGGLKALSQSDADDLPPEPDHQPVGDRHGRLRVGHLRAVGAVVERPLLDLPPRLALALGQLRPARSASTAGIAPSFSFAAGIVTSSMLSGSCLVGELLLPVGPGRGRPRPRRGRR